MEMDREYDGAINSRMDVGAVSKDDNSGDLYIQRRKETYEMNESRRRDDNDDEWDHDRSRSRSPNYRRDSTGGYNDVDDDFRKRGRISDRSRDRRRRSDEFRDNGRRVRSTSVSRNDVPKATLYVTGFTKGTSARRLAEVFEQFGPLAQVSVLPPRRSDGEQYAFVAFRRIADMDSVLDAIDQGKILDDGLAIDVIKGIDCQRARRLPASKRSRVSRDYRRRNSSREDRRSERSGDYRDRDPHDYRKEHNDSNREDYQFSKLDGASSLSSPLPPPPGQSYQN